MKLHLSQFSHQRWYTIIIQNDLMHPMELLFLIAIQLPLICFTQQPAQGLTDLALNPNGNVFLDEVFHHSEVILMCSSHFFEDAVFHIDLCLLLFIVCHIEFVQFQIIDRVLQSLEPFLLYTYLFNRQFFLIL